MLFAFAYPSGVPEFSHGFQWGSCSECRHIACFSVCSSSGDVSDDCHENEKRCPFHLYSHLFYDGCVLFCICLRILVFCTISLEHDVRVDQQQHACATVSEARSVYISEGFVFLNLQFSKNSIVYHCLSFLSSFAIVLPVILQFTITTTTAPLEQGGDQEL